MTSCYHRLRGVWAIWCHWHTRCCLWIGSLIWYVIMFVLSLLRIHMHIHASFARGIENAFFFFFGQKELRMFEAPVLWHLFLDACHEHVSVLDIISISILHQFLWSLFVLYMWLGHSKEQYRCPWKLQRRRYAPWPCKSRSSWISHWHQEGICRKAWRGVSPCSESF